MTYNPYSIVVVPFPFTDSTASKKRPAVVISNVNFQKENEIITLLMITSAHHEKWLGDHPIQNLAVAGLNSKSIVRQKIFTIDLRLIIKQIGFLSEFDRSEVQLFLMKQLNFEEKIVSKQESIFTKFLKILVRTY